MFTTQLMLTIIIVINNADTTDTDTLRVFQGHFTQLGDSQSVRKQMSNSAVYDYRQNAGSDWISLTKVRRKFQARGAAAGNARSPKVARRVGDTTSADVKAEWRKLRINKKKL